MLKYIPLEGWPTEMREMSKALQVVGAKILLEMIRTFGIV